MKNENQEKSLSPQEATPDRSIEKEPQPDTVIYLFSDIHGLSKEKMDGVLNKLGETINEDGSAKENKQKFTIFLGDLPIADIDDRAIAEFKAAKGDKSKLHFDDEDQKRTFDEIVAKRGLRAGAYRAAILNTPEKKENARKETLEKNTGVTTRMKEFPNPHVLVGNADVNVTYEGVDQLYETAGISYHTEPQLIDLGERAMIIWPSIKDPKAYSEAEKEKFNALMEEKTLEFIEQCKDKKEVMIIAHEQPFHGSKDYVKNLTEKAIKPYGAPFKGANPSSEYILKLIANLPEDIKKGIVFGHLHDKEETILQGTKFNFEDTDTGGMGKLYLWNPSIGESERVKRSVDLFYVPQNTTATLTLSKEGFKFQKFENQ